jgi:hypothetical protein
MGMAGNITSAVEQLIQNVIKIIGFEFGGSETVASAGHCPADMVVKVCHFWLDRRPSCPYHIQLPKAWLQIYSYSYG